MKNKFGGLVLGILFLTKISFALITPTPIQIQKELKQVINQYRELVQLYNQLKNNSKCIESNCLLLKNFEVKGFEILQKTHKLTYLIVKAIKNANTDRTSSKIILIQKKLKLLTLLSNLKKIEIYVKIMMLRVLLGKEKLIVR